MTLDDRQLQQRLTRFWDQEARFYDPLDGRLSGAAPAWQAWLAEALGRTRPPQAFRHRLMAGGDGRSYFYALIARRRREDEDG